MTKPRYEEVPLIRFIDGPNVRVIAMDDETKELAFSLVADGYLAPVGGVEYPDHVETLYGFRRLHAHRWAMDQGLAAPVLIPVLLYPESLTLIERETIQLIENLQRKDLSDLESYHAVKSLAARGLTLDVIGERISKSKSTVSKWINGVDHCPGEAQDHFRAGRLSLGSMYQISTSPDPLATLRALLRGESQEAGRRAGRKAAAERSDTPKEKVPRVAVPLPPADESGSSGSVTVCGQAGQGIDLVESERLLLKALKMVRDALKEGLTPRAAQAAWKAHASAKPGALAEATS